MWGRSAGGGLKHIALQLRGICASSLVCVWVWVGIKVRIGEGDIQIVIKNHFRSGGIGDIALVSQISHRLSTTELNLVCRDGDVKEGKQTSTLNQGKSLPPNAAIRLPPFGNTNAAQNTNRLTFPHPSLFFTSPTDFLPSKSEMYSASASHPGTPP